MRKSAPTTAQNSAAEPAIIARPSHATHENAMMILLNASREIYTLKSTKHLFIQGFLVEIMRAK
jgi:hypothetical protein